MNVDLFSGPRRVICESFSAGLKTKFKYEAVLVQLYFIVLPPRESWTQIARISRSTGAASQRVVVLLSSRSHFDLVTNSGMDILSTPWAW